VSAPATRDLSGAACALHKVRSGGQHELSPISLPRHAAAASDRALFP